MGRASFGDYAYASDGDGRQQDPKDKRSFHSGCEREPPTLRTGYSFLGAHLPDPD